MSFSVYELAQQFFNWLTTGNNAVQPQNVGVRQNAAGPAVALVPPVPPPPPPQLQPNAVGIQGGNLSDQIANDPRAQAIRERVRLAFPPPPPMNGLNAINMNPVAAVRSLQDELRSPQVRALRLKAHVRARQGERGHVIARHHPALTDQQLIDRLLTGLDPEGERAPTSGVSSRFASEDVFFESLKAVHIVMASALAKTRALLHENLQACAHAEAVFLATPPSPAKNTAQLGRTEAYNDLRAALQALASLPDHLPVQWDNMQRCVILYPRYAVNLFQRKQLGTGFYGTGPKPNTIVLGAAMTTYTRAQAFNGPAENSLTVFTTPAAPLNGLGRKHNIENWGLITHYPQYDEESNVQITGSN